MSGIELPVYDDAALKLLPLERLIEALVLDEDRVPRNVIDECASRGASILQALRPILTSEESYADADELHWVRLHAVMILGLLSAVDAGELLVYAMQRMDDDGDDDLQDWLSGYWPALFRNKPAEALPAVEALSKDVRRDWYMRIQAVEILLAASERSGPQALDAQLIALAAQAADEREDPDMRMQIASLFLDFPRAAYRSLLEDMARGPQDVDFVFGHEDVEQVYAAGLDTPQWTRFADPWDFYSTDAILQRQERWANEIDDDDTLYDEDWLPELPYVRGSPKVGRNDPCPCGSGKKYKKCCLAKDTQP